MFRTFLPTVALCLALPTLAAAAPERSHCQLSKGEAITNQFFFEIDPATNRALAVDAIILNAAGKPIPVEVGENTAKKLTLKWSVPVRNTRGQQTKMAFRAAIQKDSNRVIMYAKPHGYVNNFVSRGRCQRMQNPLPTG